MHSTEQDGRKSSFSNSEIEFQINIALLKMAPGSYHSSPSGREILNSKLETIIADHNKQAEEEAKVSGLVLIVCQKKR